MSENNHFITVLRMNWRSVREETGKPVRKLSKDAGKRCLWLGLGELRRKCKDVVRLWVCFGRGSNRI